jgi:hypothetical protein
MKQRRAMNREPTQSIASGPENAPVPAESNMVVSGMKLRSVSVQSWATTKPQPARSTSASAAKKRAKT